MAFTFGRRSLAFSQHVDPRLMAVAATALGMSTVVDFGMTEEQSRTVAEQRAKVAAGVSKTMASKHMIQPDGFSKALDLVPWVDGRFQWGDQLWRVTTADGRILRPFLEIAAVMAHAAQHLAVPIRWGGVWDRKLNDLAPDPVAIGLELEAYKVRHAGADFLDGPHFELGDW